MARLSPDLALPRLLERGQDEIVTLTVYRGASPVRPTSGTYTLTNESGETVSSGAVSVDSAGVASYTVAGASTTSRDYSDRWLEEWALVIDGKTERIQCDAMNVRRKLYNVVTQDTLKKLHPQIVAELLGPESPDFSAQIDEAFETFERDLIEKGNRPNLILSPWSARACVLALTLAILFRDAVTNANGESDRFRDLASSYRKEYESRFPKLTYRVDESEDGIVSDRRPAAAPVVFLSSTPRAGRRGLAE